MRKRNGKHWELDVSTGWVKRSYAIFTILMLLGIANAGVYVENGTIAYSGDFAIVTFLQNGSITVVNETLYNVSFLVVAGGGNGGTHPNTIGAGGGAGGLVEVPSYTMSAASYPAVVGTSRMTSSFGSFSMAGGGNGAGYGPIYFCYPPAIGANGGSGGGGTVGSNGALGCGCGYFYSRWGGTGATGYGHNGAYGYFNANCSAVTGGGGGGASSNGTNGTQPNGGAGYCTSISGTSTCYAGGGGGGASGVNGIGGEGGLGGGGDGGVISSATGGTGNQAGANGINGTGGGGGGGSTTGGNGGSGIVIVRMNLSYYPLPSNATGYITTCGNETNTTAINWVGHDIVSGDQINYSISTELQQVYNGTYSIQNFTGSINDTANFSLCVYPKNETAYAQTTDIITNSGYYPLEWIHGASFYSNATTNYSFYLTPYGNYTKLVQIYVVDNTLTKMTNVKVQISQINPTTAETITIGSFLVDSFGSTTQPLQPATQLYHFTVLNSAGTVLQDYANRAIPCASTDLVCQLVLVVNPTSVVPIDIISLSGSCSYASATRVVTCVGNDTSSTIAYLNLTAFAIGNTSAVCSSQSAGASGTLTCTLPNINGTYNAYFFGIDASSYNHLIDAETYTVGAQTTTIFGRDGYLAVVLLVVIAATLMTSSIAVSMAMGVFGMFVGLAFGIIPASIAIIASIFAVIALMLNYRLKV